MRLGGAGSSIYLTAPTSGDHHLIRLSENKVMNGALHQISLLSFGFYGADS